MIHKMKLQDAPFYMIAQGLKTIELRLCDEKRSAVHVGDEIIFSHENNQEEKLVTKVIAIHRFENFAQLYEHLPLEKCGYLPEEIPTASPKDMDAYYSKEQQNEYGVVGIELCLK